MVYRDDIEAAHARIEVLERELAELRGKPSEREERAREQLAELYARNHELQVELVNRRVETPRGDDRRAARAAEERNRAIDQLASNNTELAAAIRSLRDDHALELAHARAVAHRRSTSEVPEAVRGLAPLALCGGVLAVIAGAIAGGWIAAVCGGVVALGGLRAGRFGVPRDAR
jgi:hypothetical protein